MTDENNNPTENPKSQDDSTLPDFIDSLTGRTISTRGLVEHIIDQFHLEHGEGDSDAVQNAKTDVERRTLVRDVVQYVIGVESAQLSAKQQARLIATAYREIFGYGPLDTLFANPDVTTITLEGSQKISVRYAPGGNLQQLEPIFDDTHHVRRTVDRLLRDANAELHADVPIIETGLTINERRVSLSVTGPPFSPEISVDIRVHPADQPTLADLVASEFMPDEARTLLEAIIQSEHGIIIVGDTESGKTILVSALLRHLPDVDGLMTVERAGEIELPTGADQLMPQWSVGDKKGISFGEKINIALAFDPKTLVLDEIRADEPHSIADLLRKDDVPRQIWSFRGASEAKRISSSLSMLARMADRSQAEAMVLNLYRRLPFVIIVKRRKGYLQLREIGEWQFTDDSEYANYVPLMERGWETCERTGKRPQHDLDIPASFWEK